MKARIAVVFALAGLTAATVQAQDVMVKPQQTIQFKANAYGCLSKDKLDAADQHAQAGEQQKMQEFFSGFQCVSTPADSNFRVIRVVGHDVEFVNSGNSDTEGLWANDRFIKQ
jgi:DNA-binding LytR/AlgR family response regulator